MMERMFSISQVAQMLGLGIDAVRFYEKKGLVHPQVNSKNRYRMYSFYQIMELLDISYYRSLGLSIGQIHQLYESGDEEQLLCLLREKKRETEKKILYEQQLLKRIEHVGSMTARIRERGGEIDITTFPEGYVLFEQREDSLERYLEQVSSMDNDHFVFCQMVREFAIEQQEGEERLCKVPSRMMLLLDKDTAQQLGEHNEGRKTFPAMRALHSIVRLSNADPCGDGGTDVPVCKGAGNPAGKPAVYAGNSTDFLYRPGPLLCRIVYSDHSVKKNEEKACSPGRYLVK